MILMINKKFEQYGGHMAYLTEERKRLMADFVNSTEFTSVDPDAWGWGPDGQAGYFGDSVGEISPTEIDQCASTSTAVEHWVLRAFAKRNGISVPAADWWYYSEYLTNKRRNAEISA